MAKAQAVSDEQIIAALLNNGTLKTAAAAAGISERALYDRMNNGTFQALYRAAKADLIRAAVFNLNNQLQEAVNTVAEIMADKENISQRLQIDENGVIAQAESSRFDIW